MHRKPKAAGNAGKQAKSAKNVTATRQGARRAGVVSTDTHMASTILDPSVDLHKFDFLLDFSCSTEILFVLTPRTCFSFIL